MNSTRFLFSNGVVSRFSEAPPVTTFLESLPGAYTTTRTHENGSTLLFWERHITRLANSARILLNSKPELIFKPTKKYPLFFSPLSITSSMKWESRIRSLVNNSMNQVLPIALKERSDGEELAVTALVCGDFEKLKEMKNVGDDDGFFGVLDVHLHVGNYVPPVFGIEENGAHLALVGRGRDVAAAKYSAWVRLRMPLDKLRPPSVTELLLSNDGDRILEGCITNFFVICRRDKSEAEGNYPHDYDSGYSVEVQTAPITEGVLPGVIRQLVIEACLSKGIPVREVAPSWEKHGLWEEAFVTNSLRVIQHVETIKVPSSWESLGTKCSEGISWMEKKFEGPGMITKVIQVEELLLDFRTYMIKTEILLEQSWLIRGVLPRLLTNHVACNRQELYFHFEYTL
ncbi:Aminotransferase class IV - like 2, partial [Theobroma cacao]